jgi:NADH-quinone oxidoreductase subunit L
LAICGIIPFSGFWSKDEILWNAASTSQIPYGWLIWLIGTIAAVCTAFYMTRLMAMTFWGREKFLESHAHGEDDHRHDHGHGTHTPHESPPSMWVPLAVLAVFATIGGFVGISPAFTGGHHVGGRLNIVNFLEPIIWNPATGEFDKGHRPPAEEAHGPAPEQQTAHNPAGTETAVLISRTQ